MVYYDTQEQLAPGIEPATDEMRITAAQLQTTDTKPAKAGCGCHGKDAYARRAKCCQVLEIAVWVGLLILIGRAIFKTA